MKCSTRKRISAALAAIILTSSVLSGGNSDVNATEMDMIPSESSEAETQVISTGAGAEEKMDPGDNPAAEEEESREDGSGSGEKTEESQEDSSCGETVKSQDEDTGEKAGESIEDSSGENAGEDMEDGIGENPGEGSEGSSGEAAEGDLSETAEENTGSSLTEKTESTGEELNETGEESADSGPSQSETGNLKDDSEEAESRGETTIAAEAESTEDDSVLEDELGAIVRIKDSDDLDKEKLQKNGEIAELQIHAFNRREEDAELKLCFWIFDGMLPDRKEAWKELLTEPCSDIRIENAGDGGIVPIEYKTPDGGLLEGCIYQMQDKEEDILSLWYLQTELPAQTETDFEISVCADTDQRIVVVPVVFEGTAERYFEEVYLSWESAEDEEKTTEGGNDEETETETETETEIETETETEHFLEQAEGTEQLNASDFSSMRLIVLASVPEIVIDPEHIAADYGNIYLLQYGSVQQAMNAYMYYLQYAEAVEPDTVLSTAAENLTEDGEAEEDIQSEEDAGAAESIQNEGDGETAAEEKNPITVLAEEQDFPAVGAADRPIALIDTGVSEGENIIGRVSLIDDTLEGNGHGNEMVAAILSQNPSAGILSVRALGNDGRGTVSSVVAAIEYAIEQKVSIINLSMYAKAGTANDVLRSEIQKAVSEGIDVVGAAGNDGADASGYMPGSVGEAWIIGACDETGARRNNSNYGATVDYYVAAHSTSEASAKFTGYISANGTENIYEVLGQGVIFAEALGIPEESTQTEEEDDSSSDSLIAAAPTSFVIQDGKPAWAPEALRQGRASTHKRKVIFGSEEKWAYCLEPLKGAPTHDTEFSISSATQLGANNNIAKVLYYLYGGPAWGKDVNGVNLKTIMTEAGCSTGNHYYAMTHYVAAYFYLGGDESKWNAHPEGPGVLNSAGVQLVKTLVGHIKNMPGINDATASLSPASVSAYYDAARNVYVSQPVTYHTFSGNTGKITLPAGISLVNDSTGSVTLSGTAKLAGGNIFHFETAVSPAAKTEYTLTCAVARDFSAYRKSFSGDAQDMGFVYFSGDKTLKLSVSWPVYGYIEVEKHDSNTGTTVPTGGYSMDGAKYGIYDSAGTLVSSLTIVNGKAVSGTLVPGSYTVREITAPAHYSIDTAAYTVTVEASKTTNVISSDTPVPVKVNVRKISNAGDEILNLSGYSRANAEFGVYTNRECTNKLAVLKTDEQGMSNEFTLPLPGAGGSASVTYYVREDKAPAGHCLNPNPVPFTVSYPADSGKTVTVEVSDEPEFADVNAVIEKLSEKGNKIAGVQFEARYYDSDKADTGKLMKTWVLESDANGEVYLDEAHKAGGDAFYVWNGHTVIPKGYLTIQEVKAPAWYTIDDTVYEWDTHGKELELKTVYNDLVPGKITLYKFDNDGKTALPGVSFELKFLKASEQSTDMAHPDRFLLKEGETVQVTTDARGEAVFENLDLGDYQLTEVSTVAGHTLLKEPLLISLPIAMSESEIKEHDNVDLSRAKLNSGYDEKYYFFECTYEITNEYTFKLPVTGAAGGWKYGYLGMAMTAVLCGGLVFTRRRRIERKSGKIYRRLS